MGTRLLCSNGPWRRQNWELCCSQLAEQEGHVRSANFDQNMQHNCTNVVPVKWPPKIATEHSIGRISTRKTVAALVINGSSYLWKKSSSSPPQPKNRLERRLVFCTCSSDIAEAPPNIVSYSTLKGNSVAKSPRLLWERSLHRV